MLKFDANLTMLYPKLGFLDSFAAAAADGFKAVEYRAPFSVPKEAVSEELARHGLTQVQFNCPAGDWAAGERGIACLPGREAEFREGIALSIDYAQALGAPQVNCLAGVVPQGLARDVAEATLVENFRFAAERLAGAGIKLQLEAINHRDNPGGLVATTADFERIFEKVGSDNLYLQYDFYHMQVMQGDLVRTFERLQPQISHVQVADNPGRHEPGTGEINYAFIFDALERLRYDGWVGCEYVPLATAGEGLGWLRERL